MRPCTLHRAKGVQADPVSCIIAAAAGKIHSAKDQKCSPNVLHLLLFNEQSINVSFNDNTPARWNSSLANGSATPINTTCALMHKPVLPVDLQGRAMANSFPFQTLNKLQSRKWWWMHSCFKIHALHSVPHSCIFLCGTKEVGLQKSQCLFFFLKIVFVHAEGDYKNSPVWLIFTYTSDLLSSSVADNL